MAPKKKNDSAVSNNNQNVTVGTLADAQKPDVRKSEKLNVGEGNGSRKDRYMYCDFAQIDEEEYDVDYEIDQEGLLQALDESTTMAAAQTVQHQSISYLQQPPPVLRASGWVRSQRFPTKLYALLSQPQLSSIITWMPHGRSWKVLKPRVFETSVLPVFFESDNYHSFNRVINAWSFRRKSTGPDRGSYFHELFLRGKPHLQKYMRRLPRTHKKLAMAKSEEPDFFDLQKTSPLPTLDQARLNLESRKLLRLREHFENETVVQGGVPERKRSPIANASHDDSALDKHSQTKREVVKQAESWNEDQGNRTTTSPATFQNGRQQAIKERVDEFSHGINQTPTLPKKFKVPESFFRLTQKDELIKEDVDLQSRVSGHSLLRQPQQQQQQQQARAVQQQVQVDAAMFQQQQQLLARHHRAQMMQLMEQEQYSRAQDVRKAELAHQQHNQINLLRQMDFLQQHQRTGY